MAACEHRDVTPGHADDLRQAAEAYRRAHERAADLIEPAREQLAEAIRKAYAAGMRKSDILRATDHVWSRQWIDETVRDVPRE